MIDPFGFRGDGIEVNACGTSIFLVGVSKVDSGKLTHWAALSVFWRFIGFLFFGRGGKQMEKGRFLDDFKVGEVFRTEGITITDSEIIGFAMRYDPQAFHMDVIAASKSPYGGLIASGFHTLSLCFRLFIQKGVIAACSIGSPGIDEVRWLAPVRPGDTLRTETEVLEIKPSSSKPDRGILRLRYAGINQREEKVISFILNHLLLRKTV